MPELDELDLEHRLSDDMLRDVFSHIAASVTVVTTRDDQGRACGMTVSSFTTVSLDPPLILFCLGNTAFHADDFLRTDTFAVNILKADQEALSNRFAEERHDDFSDLPIGSLTTGSPILKRSLAALDCRTEARHRAGDHVIIIGRVCEIEPASGGEPLLYCRRGYRRLRPSG